MVTLKTIGWALAAVRRAVRRWDPPVVGRYKADPFTTLISCLISLRTKDEVTREASRRLFALARRPASMLRLSRSRIERAIFPAGFYRTKAKTILEVCRMLEARYGGRVPSELEALLELPGVGRKTANLVVTLAFGKPGICVDTHVHRISNRWGFVRTRTPDETEMALRRRLPARYWITYNDLLVSFGQHLCHPTSPWCSRCPVSRLCPRLGVRHSR
ncbi:MAG TPA: endonuclease III [bacterium]